MIIKLPTKRIALTNISQFYPRDGGENQPDMGRNYVTITQCMHYDDDIAAISVVNACERGRHVVQLIVLSRMDLSPTGLPHIIPCHMTGHVTRTWSKTKLR